MGAWIETLLSVVSVLPVWSHPMWVRGLKLQGSQYHTKRARSHPMWVRGLKLRQYVPQAGGTQSHPMWVRGLKQLSGFVIMQKVRSHPMWVRGLKLTRISIPILDYYVAPYVGAWIETSAKSESSVPLRRRTLCGCVD